MFGLFGGAKRKRRTKRRTGKKPGPKKRKTSASVGKLKTVIPRSKIGKGKTYTTVKTNKKKGKKTLYRVMKKTSKGQSRASVGYGIVRKSRSVSLYAKAGPAASADRRKRARSQPWE